MTEPTPEVQPDPVTKAARDLTAIESLFLALPDQAEHSSNSRLMPGGTALALMAPHGSHEAWEAMNDTTERTGRHYTSAEDEDPEDSWDTFMLLSYWSEAFRRELDEEHQPKPTILSEASYLRWRLEWAWDHEPRFGDMAADIRKARVRLENVVHAGSRAERSRVVCDCEDAPRLIRTWGATAAFDGWKCPACKALLSEDDHKRMFARQLRSEGAEKYVPLPEAVAVLRDEGRPERTIRKWLGVSDDHEDVVGGYCEVRTRRVLAWWPDLWHRHLTTARRKRDAAA